MTATPQYNGPIVFDPIKIITDRMKTGGAIYADADLAEAQAIASEMNEFEAKDAADHGNNEYRAHYVVVALDAGGFKIGVYDYDSGDLFAYYPPSS